MIRFATAATTDVGQVRAANEDGYFEGDSVFAVADGMGGHVAGEVASSTALEPIAALDGRVFPDAATAAASLRSAVLEANQAVARKAAGDPSYRGMGTTLTAAMVEGRRLHVAHVGDSRAYLLRGRTFSQLTEDHTLVQRLVEEGQLSHEEAEHHPQRSVVTRAVGVNRELEVDTLTLELAPGDQILVCSDGLTGVVSDTDIAHRLLADQPPAEAVEELVRLANDSGGPDNITVVLLRVTTERSAGGRADPGERDPDRTVVVPRPADHLEDHHWADRLSQLGTFGQARGDPLQRPALTGRGQRLGALLVALAVLAAIAGGGGWWLLSRSYYVGIDDEQVAIYRGVPGNLGPLGLSWVYEDTRLRVEDVPAYFQNNLADGIIATDRHHARRIVASAPRREPPESAPTATSPQSPTPSPSPSPAP